MNTLLVFVWIYAAMIATSIWEAAVEGKNSWDKGKLGFKIKIGNYTVLTAYHFFLFGVMFPLLLSLPLVILGWDTRLFGILLSAYASGMIIEDFFWFVVNPSFNLKNWNSKNVDWYLWLKLGKLQIPVFYLVSIIIAVASWYFLWS